MRQGDSGYFRVDAFVGRDHHVFGADVNFYRTPAEAKAAIAEYIRGAKKGEMGFNMEATHDDLYSKGNVAFLWGPASNSAKLAIEGCLVRGG